MMDKKETVASLIAYLHALCDVSQNSEVRVFTEIKRTVAKIEKLLEQ